MAPVEVVDTIAQEGRDGLPAWASLALLAGGGVMLLGLMAVAVVAVGALSGLASNPEPSATLADRGRVLEGGTEEMQPRVATELTYRGPGGIFVQIEGPHGFRAEWTGREPFDLGRVRVGTYEATVSQGDQVVARMPFEVAAGMARCDFLLDQTAEQWTGGCTK